MRDTDEARYGRSRERSASCRQLSQIGSLDASFAGCSDSGRYFADKRELSSNIDAMKRCGAESRLRVEAERLSSNAPRKSVEGRSSARSRSSDCGDSGFMRAGKRNNSVHPNAAGGASRTLRVDRYKTSSNSLRGGRQNHKRSYSLSRSTRRFGSARDVYVGRDTRGGWSSAAYRTGGDRIGGVLRGIGNAFVSFVLALASLVGSFVRFFSDRWGFVPFVLAAALLVIAVFLGGRVLGSKPSDSVPVDAADQTVAYSLNLDDIERVLGEELGERMYLMGVANPDLCWIASHPDAYAQFGDEMQVKLLTLAARDWAAASFVRGYPNADAPQGVAAYDGSDSEINGFPVLFQWDTRWGYLPYSGGTIGTSGCGPTALSIVYQGITGLTDMPPSVMADYARENGYMTASDGTDVLLLTNGAYSLGLSAGEIPVKADNLTWTLDSGVPVIAKMGPGDFTENGHYIVLAGFDDEGRVLVVDPYSHVNTMQSWGLDTIVSQAYCFVAYYG